MLELINGERIKAGLSVVVMGDNRAAQIHAENSLANCISSHWSADGLNPDMRYSLAGGYQSNRENVIGQDYCRLPGQGYSAIASIAQKVHGAMRWWMESPGHRSTILVPRHSKVNIGLAWDRYNFVAVQKFERDNVEYTMLPAIEGRQLSMEGRVKNGANLAHGDHIRVTILYSPPPHSLTQGQIARVYGNCPPRKVVFLSYKSSGEQESSWETCPTPYDFPPESPAPSSASDAHRMWEEARSRWEDREKVPVTVRRIKMSKWQLDGDRFAISADIGDVLDAYGPGVYTMTLFGVLDGAVTPISEYAIFHGVPQPTGYGLP